MRPHPQAGRAVPQGLWTGECNITAYWGASHPSRDFLVASEVAVASGCERGRQETNETFFSVCFFFPFHTYLSAALFPGGVKVRRKQADVPGQGSSPPIESPENLTVAWLESGIRRLD